MVRDGCMRVQPQPELADGHHSWAYAQLMGKYKASTCSPLTQVMVPRQTFETSSGLFPSLVKGIVVDGMIVQGFSG